MKIGCKLTEKSQKNMRYKFLVLISIHLYNLNQCPVSTSPPGECGSVTEVRLSNEVEKKQWRLSLMHGIEIISNKLLNFMFTYIEQYIKQFYYTLLLSVYQAIK